MRATEIADRLKMSRATLYRRIAKLKDGVPESKPTTEQGWHLTWTLFESELPLKRFKRLRFLRIAGANFGLGADPPSIASANSSNCSASAIHLSLVFCRSPAARMTGVHRPC